MNNLFPASKLAHVRGGHSPTHFSISSGKCFRKGDSNLTIRDNRSFAVGEFGVLVHNRAWCEILENLPKGLGKKYQDARQWLAKHYKVTIDRIHGHHIVQKTVPAEAYNKTPCGNRIIDHSKVDPTWTEREQSAWYIAKSQKILQDAKIPIYSPSEFGSEQAAKEAAHLAGQAGKRLHNLTFALNDKNLVHTLQTHKAVYERLLTNKGKKARLEAELIEMGDQFMQGKPPR